MSDPIRLADVRASLAQVLDRAGRDRELRLLLEELPTLEDDQLEPTIARLRDILGAAADGKDGTALDEIAALLLDDLLGGLEE